MEAEQALEKLERLEKAAKIFLKNHHGHHPLHCIGGCDQEACGESELQTVLREIKL